MLRLEAACKAYTRQGKTVEALRPTSLDIGAGESVAVVGPSGCGKSTFLTVVGGMMAPTTGKVWLEGRSLYDLTVSQRAAVRGTRIGVVFQTFNLVPYLSALENVQVPLYLAGVGTKEQRGRATAALERVGLAERLEHKPSELSVGQQQRVALARTLVNDPALILADEPTGNLDPDTREQVLGLFEEFHGEGRTLVVVTHDPAVAARSRRVLRLQAGAVSGVEDIAPQLAVA
jgi:putative ABC transport system ATP-binding protein